LIWIKTNAAPEQSPADAAEAGGQSVLPSITNLLAHQSWPTWCRGERSARAEPGLIFGRTGRPPHLSDEERAEIEAMAERVAEADQHAAAYQEAAVCLRAA
jgi:hypothetical protein